MRFQMLSEKLRTYGACFVGGALLGLFLLGGPIGATVGVIGGLWVARKATNYLALPEGK